MKLQFLQVPKFPTQDALWAVLVETKRQRRRMQLSDGLVYAKDFGIKTETELNLTITELLDHERDIQNQIENYSEQDMRLASRNL